MVKFTDRKGGEAAGGWRLTRNEHGSRVWQQSAGKDDIDTPHWSLPNAIRIDRFGNVIYSNGLTIEKPDGSTINRRRDTSVSEIVYPQGSRAQVIYLGSSGPNRDTVSRVELYTTLSLGAGEKSPEIRTDYWQITRDKGEPTEGIWHHYKTGGQLIENLPAGSTVKIDQYGEITVNRKGGKTTVIKTDGTTQEK